MSPNPEMYLPEIFDFETLFGNTKSETVEEGFPHGATIVMGGPPGAGQSAFTLAVIRDLLMQKRQHARLYYINTISGADDLQRRYRPCGWFSASDELQSRMHVVEVAEIRLPGPARNADELMNPAFTQIRAIERRHEPTPVFVIIDTLTDLIKDSRSDGDRRRSVHELIARLKASFPIERLALSFLVSDWTAGTRVGEAVEEHIADFVFRFNVERSGFERRRRTVEITKSEGAVTLLGTHTWALLTKRNIITQIASRRLRREIINREKGHDGERPNWGTIAVFPRPSLFPIGKLQLWETLPNEERERREPATRITTGTPGLDEMLTGDTRYWSQRGSSRDEMQLSNGLYRGSTSIVLGKSGTGKTLSAVQFLLADPAASLYVNFENRPSRVANVFPTKNVQQLLQECETLYRRRANLDFNTLLSEIRHILVSRRGKQIERIAIDGLSDLFIVSDKREFAQVVEDLLVSIRQTSLEILDAPKENGEADPITIFVTLEVDIGSEVFPMLDSISFTADNLIVLRHVMINDELRKTVQVLKARGHSPDKQIRELVVRADSAIPVRVARGLENYSGLHTANPKPVTVTVQLIAENECELNFNKETVGTLTRLFMYPVDTLGFSRNEIHRTLLDIAAGSARTPHSNVKLMSIDEWWIRELRAAQPRNSDRVPRPHPLLALDPFLLSTAERAVTNSRVYEAFHSDFWINEFEKATSPDVRPCSDGDIYRTGELELNAEMVACPSHMDFGVFCINPSVASELGESEGCGRWPDALSVVPRAWVERKGGWFRNPDNSDATVVDFMHRLLKKNTTDCVGFAFDMETPATSACAFLEFCWAFGASEDFLIRDVAAYETLNDGERESFVREHPMTVAFQFLSFLVVTGLMRARTTVNDSRRSILSRHWFSTVVDLDQKSGSRMTHGPVLFPLPFFPVGAPSSGNTSPSRRFASSADSSIVSAARLASKTPSASVFPSSWLIRRPSSCCRANIRSAALRRI